jgi:hypothetical protein
MTCDIKEISSGVKLIMMNINKIYQTDPDITVNDLINKIKPLFESRF